MDFELFVDTILYRIAHVGAKKKGVTVQNRNPLNYLWWRRGDLNSRPPPCEGDALPAELLPHMGAATRRSVVCMPFMCRGQVFFAGGTSGGRGHGRRDGKSRTAAGPGASRGKAAACPPASGRSGEARRLPEKGEEAPGTRQGGEGNVPCPWRASFSPERSFGGCGPYPCRGAREPAMPRQGLPAGNVRTGQSAGRPSRIAFLRPCAAKKSAGPPLWGLATAKKKRYRSPLVSL